MGKARLSVGNTEAVRYLVVRFESSRDNRKRPAAVRSIAKQIVHVGAGLRPALRCSAQSIVYLAIILIFHSLAFAHAYLVKSIPAQRAVLLRAPAKIQLWFNERLESQYSTLSITDEAGKSVAVSAVEIDAEDPKRITATVSSLRSGRYLVKYRVLSVDGHIVQDQFTFTVKQ